MELKIKSQADIFYTTKENKIIQATAEVELDVRMESEGGAAVNVFIEVPDQKISAKYSIETEDGEEQAETDIQLKDVDTRLSYKDDQGSKFWQITLGTVNINEAKNKADVEVFI